MGNSKKFEDSDQTVLELLGLIKKVELTIGVHESVENPDTLAIEQYDDLRTRYTSELLEILKQEYGLQLRPAISDSDLAA